MCCLAGLTASLPAFAQESPLTLLRPALPEVGTRGENPDGLPALPASRAANYGKPQLSVPGGRKSKKVERHLLPQLVAYPTSAQVRRNARTFAAINPAAAPSPTVAVSAPIPHRPKPRLEDNPFAPVGIDAGPLRLRLYEETSLGANSNPNDAPQGSPLLRGSGFLRQEIGASGQSDWSNHGFAGDLRLGYIDYFTAHSADAPDGAGKFTTRIDVARDTKIKIDGNFDLTTQSPTSPNLYNGGAPIILTSRPIIADYGGGVGATRDFNRLELTIRGGYERTWWQNAHFSDGSTQYLSLDSYDAYALSARAAYEWTPGIKPFVQAVFDRRIHDTLYDTSGYERNSAGEALQTGSTFELTRLLTGSLQAGYADRHYQDPRLANLRGPVFDASLVWTATALTKVTLRGATTLDETTVAGVSGAITRRGAIEVSHALLRNLTLTAVGSWQNSAYPGANPGLDQTLIQASLRAEYSLTRAIILKGSFTSQRLISTTPGTDYTANIFMVGLRLQQ
ncbi:outer membrane beta-barrel protein [uncultured Rhodoblastus sp.]|uniref:outer membrane beta-barrel protein n=1 Tax=uncultured Rhodoblastus sp. TaxID=543037 RepID=UPI0025CF1E8E|nr:outer membrane beta-barrel protein [uncultured Rhodoblastus sp.]